MGRILTRTLIGLAVGALFVWLSARDWPLDRVASGGLSLEAGHLVVGQVDLATLARAHERLDAPAIEAATQGGWAMELGWLWPYLLVLSLIHVLRVVRYKPLLDPIVELDLWAHNRIGAVGFMAMFLMPLRLGELVRPYLVKRTTEGVRMSSVLSTVVVERVADGLTVALALFGVLALLPASDPETGQALWLGAWAAFAVFAGASVVLAGFRWQHDRTVRLMEWALGWLSHAIAHRIVEKLDAFLHGLGRMPSPRAFAWFVLLTLIYWGLNGVGVWLMARAFYLPVDMVGAYAMMACVVVGMMIPNSPGNVGSFWYFLLLPVGLYGVSGQSTQAIAFGLVVWLAQLVQQGAFGAWFLMRGQVAWSRVVEATREEAELDEAVSPTARARSEPAPAA